MNDAYSVVFHKENLGKQLNYERKNLVFIYYFNLMDFTQCFIVGIAQKKKL